jgi:3-oxoacyl-[acyl-carrier-protein] synthase III
MRFQAVESLLPSRLITNEMVVDHIEQANRDSLSAADLSLLLRRIRALLLLARTDTRYIRADHETALGLGIEVAQAALRTAGMEPSDIDLLIYVGVARGYVEPATANIYQARLGMVNATCFDLLDACASWLRALHIGRLFINAGVYRHVMILNAEFNTREYSNFQFSSLSELRYRFSSFGIGEAATATIIGPDDDPEADQFYASFRNSGCDHGLATIALPHHHEYDGDCLNPATPLQFTSDGERLFQVAMTKVIEHYEADPVVQQFRPDIAFSHSASDSMSERIARHLGIGPTYLTHARFGNTVSASVPLGMATALKEDALRPGMNVLVGCASAGITTGWACFRFLQ